MTRLTIAQKEETKKMNPWWRGIGCLLAIAIFVASFLISTWLVGVITDREHPPALPTQISFLPSALRAMTSQFRGMMPWFGGIGQYAPPLFVALVVSLLMYGVINLAYVFVRGDGTDPRDVRKYEPPGRKKRNVRRCR